MLSASNFFPAGKKPKTNGIIQTVRTSTGFPGTQTTQNFGSLMLLVKCYLFLFDVL